MTGTCIEAIRSSGCGGGIVREDSNMLLAMSAMLSVAAENAGGDSVHPIGSRVGIATRGGSSGLDGKGIARLRAPDGERCNW